MSRRVTVTAIRQFSLAILLLAVSTGLAFAGAVAGPSATPFDTAFSTSVRPFLQRYCVSCHGKDKTEADLDLSLYTSMPEAVKDSGRWGEIVGKLEANKMPPKKAKLRPTADERARAAQWFKAAGEFETSRNAGDPGVVPVRRLNDAEYDYTIRDLTGVDIRPAKEFPADPDNPAGFDNSGESLTMSPSLLQKYLQAAHQVASYLALKPDGFTFAPFPILADTDRDKYCVSRIIDFYHAQDTDYADYFDAAWRFKHRAALGKSEATLDDIAAERKVSPKYLKTLCTALEEQIEPIGPMVKLQQMWRQLPAPDAGQQDTARPGCEQMRDYVLWLRKKVEPRFLNITAGRISPASEPLLIWKNVQYATHRMTFDPAQLQVDGEEMPVQPDDPEPGAENEFGPGHTVLIHNVQGDPDLTFPPGQRARFEAAFARFCRIFPDRFFMQERGRNYFDTTKDRGRYLNAGFHSLMGYFRDDQPLYELILTSDQQKELDAMWRDLDFVASASKRTYIQFCGSGQRGERGIAQTEGKSAEAFIDVTTEPRIRELEKSYLSKAGGDDPRGIEAIKSWFEWMNTSIRWTEKARRDAEPGHLKSILELASRAYRRPLSKDEQKDILDYYQSSRQAGMDHESAIREGIVSILMSPDFCYRLDLMQAEGGPRALSDYELASRLSYFLWSSMPDQKLLDHARAGDLHKPDVLAAQVQRMLHDPRMRALATQFGGAWLDFRRFDQITSVDRDRFPVFTNEVREAMYEEPIRFLVDAFASNRSMLDLIDGNYTFVNPVLARFYGMPVPTSDPNDWVRVDGADRFGRGGLLPMAVFMTKNAPGLRTSPVKRGNWVVKNILGEKIPAPPPNRPDLPADESKLELPLRDMLARHRQDPNCASCHARFDSFGLVFEGFGPVGERRLRDLAGHPVDTSATFPDGESGQGVAGLREYIHAHRQKDFVDNFSRKLLAYALGRSLIASDELLIRQLHDKLEKNEYRLNVLIEGIVTSPQFLNKRGREQVAQR